MGYPQKSSSSYDNYHATTMRNDNAYYCKNDMKYARIILILGVSLLYLVEGAINGGQKKLLALAWSSLLSVLSVRALGERKNHNNTQRSR